ncbi:MAG: flagellar assembly protein FliW [Planctomycetota bacterium]|nr:flagellar assembly protein FliW [Planctomycetota bacterium]
MDGKPHDGSVPMNVQTTRFGMVEIDQNRIINFEAGLLGFSSYRRYVLLQPDDDGVFFWLQSIESPELAFVVTDPSLWVANYQATIRREQMDELQLGSLETAQVLVIVNKYDRSLTGNLQGPLVVNLDNYQGVQLVLAEKKWTTRHEIVQLGESAQVATA